MNISQQFRSNVSSDERYLGLTGNYLDIENLQYPSFNDEYKNFLDESGSDCSTDLIRRSLPTQTESLSDVSSDSSKKITGQTFPGGDLNLSSEDQFNLEMGKFVKERLPMDKEKDTHSASLPKFAANPFVRVPENIPPFFYDFNIRST